MVYLGRVVGAGYTRDGLPAVVYGVSVRSAPNKARKAMVVDTRAFIGSSLEGKTNLTEEESKILARQRETAEFIFYNGIIASLGPYAPFVIVGNSVHTAQTLERFIDSKDGEDSVVQYVLNEYGPELDGPNRTPQTPRISGLIELGTNRSVLGIVSKASEAITFMRPRKDGLIEGISTYAGEQQDPNAMVINHDHSILTLPSEGRTAKKLSDDLFDWLDPNLRVCTAAAVWNSRENKWDLDKTNLHL